MEVQNLYMSSPSLNTLSPFLFVVQNLAGRNQRPSQTQLECGERWSLIIASFCVAADLGLPRLIQSVDSSADAPVAFSILVR